jgi:Leucine-rich repeat (LRR) protein
MENIPKEALARIYTVCRNGEKKLSLSGLGLLELPPEIRSLSYLTHLDLSKNPIQNVDLLQNLICLEELKIQETNVHEIPMCVLNLPQLKKILM